MLSSCDLMQHRRTCYLVCCEIATAGDEPSNAAAHPLINSQLPMWHMAGSILLSAIFWDPQRPRLTGHEMHPEGALETVPDTASKQIPKDPNIPLDLASRATSDELQIDFRKASNELQISFR